MKNIEVCTELDNAITLLGYARTALQSVMNDYFSSLKPDVSALEHDYSDISNMLGAAAFFARDVEELLKTAVDGIEIGQEQEGKA